MQFNKFAIYSLAFLMAFYSLFLASASVKALDSLPAPLPASGVATMRIQVVHAIAAGTVVPEAVSEVRQAVCDIGSSSGFLQGGTASGLFAKPANCFNIVVSKELAAPKVLSIQNGPVHVPQIVVYRLAERLEKEYHIPAVPAAEPAASLPAAVTMLLAALIAFKETLYASSKRLAGDRVAKPVSLQQLQMLRC